MPYAPTFLFFAVNRTVLHSSFQAFTKLRELVEYLCFGCAAMGSAEACQAEILMAV